MKRIEKELTRLAQALERNSGDGKGETQARGQAALDILELCRNNSWEDIQSVDESVRRRIAASLLSRYNKYKEILVPAQQAAGASWMFEDDYSQYRYSASLVLDLIGYFPLPEVVSELEGALYFHDPRLKLFAISSLLRSGKTVSAKEVFQTAASPEVRNYLYDHLEELGRLDIYPLGLLTQEAFAESKMVEWLTYPTELGCTPDEIELMNIFSDDVGPPDGILDWYVFRFRTFPPHWAADKGWMAGVAGPYLRKDAPSTQSYGGTFSTFDEWESKPPEEHLTGIIELLHEWSEHQSKNQQ